MTEHQRHIELGIGGERACAGDHIAFLWETPEEFAEGVKFLARGLDADDHAVVFGHREANEQVLAVLRASGVDVERALTSGRLTLMQGSEDAGAMLAGIGASFQESVAKGARLIRLLGNLGWGHSGWPSEAEIIAFEAKVTEAARLFPCLIVCMYDVQGLSGPIMVHGAYETHTHTVHRRILRENPYLVRSHELLRGVNQGTGAK